MSAFLQRHDAHIELFLLCLGLLASLTLFSMVTGLFWVIKSGPAHSYTPPARSVQSETYEPMNLFPWEVK